MGRRVSAIAAALLVALLGAAGVIVYAQSADARAVAGQATQQVYIAVAAGAGRGPPLARLSPRSSSCSSPWSPRACRPAP